ncbi:MAG: glutamyl-tRNA reductase [Conexivisphaerales archaeon]
MPSEHTPILETDAPRPEAGRQKEQVSTLTLLGLSYRTSDISYRERVYFALDSLKRKVNDESIVDEFLSLVTCSRIELYFVAKNPQKAVDFILSSLPDAHSGNRFYIKKDLDTIKHIYSVAAGLDSIAVGERQILLQVKTASRLARINNTSRSILSSVFDSAISTAIKLREKYRIDDSVHDVSLSSIGVKFLMNRLGAKPHAVLLLGNGKMARLALRELEDTSIFVATSIPRHVNSAPHVKYIGYDNIKEVINSCDVVISATKKNDFVIKSGDISRNKKILILDLGFPRNVDPKLSECDAIELYNVDDLSEYVPNYNIDSVSMYQDLENEARKFYIWLYTTKLSRIITELFRWAEKIRAKEVSIAKKKMGSLTAKQSETIDLLSSSIMKKFLYHVIQFAKDSDSYLSTDQRLRLISTIFNLEGENYHERD